MSESEIALRLGVSRTPIREAIVALEGEGLLTVRPQVGTTVAPIDVDAVTDGQFVRESVECRTVTLAAQRVRPAHARELKSLLDRQARVARRGDHAAFVPLDDDLHRRLCEIAGRPRVWRTVENVKAQLDRVRFLSLDPVWLETICQQHETIVSCVLAGDGDGAARAMSLHLNAVFESLATLAEASPALFRPSADAPLT